MVILKILSLVTYNSIFPASKQVGVISARFTRSFFSVLYQDTSQKLTKLSFFYIPKTKEIMRSPLMSPQGVADFVQVEDAAKAKLALQSPKKKTGKIGKLVSSLKGPKKTKKA